MKNLYLIRGVSGSGKSTLGKELAGEYCFAADDYFINQQNGQYNWDPAKLGAAHQRCIDNVERTMSKELGPIAVANTFTQLNDMKPYRELAAQYGYKLFILIADGDYENQHSVPLATLNKQSDSFTFNNRYMNANR